MQERLDDLNKRKEEALQPGSQRSVDRQHEKGKLLARERIEYLLDPGSFHELDMLARHRAFNSGIEERPLTDGVITGWGTIDGRKVFVFSQDFTVFGGALGEVFADWGIPTPESIRQCSRVPGVTVIGSGGLRHGVDVAKAIALGADLAGMAFPFLAAATESPEAVVARIERIVEELRIAMFCTGARTVAELKRAPIEPVSIRERTAP